MVDGCDGKAVPFLDVTIPNDRTWVTDAAVFYSIHPWIFGLILLLATVALRRVTLMFALLFGVVCVFVNEGIVKRIVSQDRPYGTCLSSKGMPSSHSLLAIGYTTFTWLEMLLHHFFIKNENRTTFMNSLKLGFAVALGILMIPVPISRVELKDHSKAQVTVGSLIGIGLAIAYVLMLHSFLAKWIYKKWWAASTDSSSGGEGGEKYGTNHKRGVKCCVRFDIMWDYGWPRDCGGGDEGDDDLGVGDVSSGGGAAPTVAPLPPPEAPSAKGNKGNIDSDGEEEEEESAAAGKGTAPHPSEVVVDDDI
eukprot:PhM_4_TR14880/c0_g1_i1/m.107106/K07252/E3.6.1.43; dolichyldiphosphatase